MENKNQPINPVVKPGFVYSDGSHEESSVVSYGLTKREYFAGLAMQGMIAAGWDSHDMFEEAAKRSCLAADALLNQLNPSKP